MEITFWGVRGTVPAPGPEFNRYGGNTSCVSVRSSGGSLLILDAGTGLNVLGRSLMQGDFARGTGSATILLTHAHWDHIQGFPFFAPFYVAGNRFVIHGPSESPAMVEGILEGQMNPHFSPLHSLRNLGAEIEFRASQEGTNQPFGDLILSWRSIPHGRSSALAYRIEDRAGSLVYVPDAGYLGLLPEAPVQEIYQGATFLIHDCTYTPEDQEARRSRGNASIANAARVAVHAGVGTLVMFHYDQDYSDTAVDALEQRCRLLLDELPGGQAVQLLAAREGLTLGARDKTG